MAPKKAGRGRPTKGTAYPEENELCLLCLQLVTDDSHYLLKTCGLTSLERISRDRRKDGLHAVLTGRETLWLHKNCHKQYTKTECIDRYVSRVSADQVLEDAPVLPRAQSQQLNFEVQRDCLFCGEATVSDQKYKKMDSERRKKNAVHRVKEVEFKSRVETWIKARPSDDPWRRAVQSRVNLIHVDFPAAEVRYHRACSVKFCSKDRSLNEGAVGRPGGSNEAEKDVAANVLFGLIDGSDECQYSLKELQDIMQERCGVSYTTRTLKSKLSHRYGEAVTITGGSQIGGDAIVNFTGFASKLLYDRWYEERRETESDEKERVVRLAAQFILEDIKKTVCDLVSYPPMAVMSESSLPRLLMLFLTVLITTKSPITTAVERKRHAIGQAIMLACRPRSYVPPFLLALGTHLHRCFASRGLIDLLHSIGFSVSYGEVKRYVYNLSKTAGESLRCMAGRQQGQHCQYVFDNADWNTATLDGHNTFHCLGGIRVVSPPSDAPSTPVPREAVPANKISTDTFNIPITDYIKPRVNGLTRITVRAVGSSALSLGARTSVIQARVLDALWQVGRYVNAPDAPSWSGFMKKAMKGTISVAHKSGVEVLPFIDMAPTNLTTLYSAMLFVVLESAERGLGEIWVTLDQQLYVKVVEMVASDVTGRLSNIKVRLGGFHLLMSFMGAVSYIMRGSGLEDLWSEVYAANTVSQMMMGNKQYSRALRAHFLVQEALGHLLLNKARVSGRVDEATLVEARRMHQAFLEGTVTAAEVDASTAVQRVLTALWEEGDNAAQRSRTAKLWSLYYRLVGLIRLYVRAERTGDWALHLDVVATMLPIFHAAAHLNYAKAAHLYVQQMEELVGDLDHAAREGMFTVRRTACFWSGVWTDMTIEQDLMRPLKAQGGLTRGRGLTESVRSEWIMSAPAVREVSVAVENFCAVYVNTSDQHVEMRASRQERDKKDLGKFLAWLGTRSPFDDCSEGIKCIADGKRGSDKVNCDRAEEIGLTLLQKTYGTNFATVKLERKGRVVPLSEAPPKAKNKEAEEEVNTNLLFMRMCRLGVTDAKLKEYLKYELASKPPSLFDAKGLMRHNNKATLMRRLHCSAVEGNEKDDDDDADGLAALEGLPELDIHATEQEASGTSLAGAVGRDGLSCTVVDGGYLLHVVRWPRVDDRDVLVSYGDVCAAYVKHVTNNYGRPVVVFDGYEVRWSTKCEEQQRRTFTKKPCPDIDVEDDTRATVQREDFLSNKNNKSSLIRLLSRHLRDQGVEVLQADADADVPIAETAIELARDHPDRPVTVVATDTDIIAILAARADDGCCITVCHPGTSRYPEKVFPIHTIIGNLGEMRACILVAHAISGCDTTSAIFRKGKLKVWDSLKRDADLRAAAAVFLDPEADRREIVDSGEKILASLYAKPKGLRGTVGTVTGLDQLRFLQYVDMVKRTKNSSTVDLADLPPTSDAARQHSLRVYLQVQQWMGNSLNPTAWGWRATQNTLEPIPTLKLAAPQELLKLVSCNCDKGACMVGTNCTCRKSGLPCSKDCGICEGENCRNRLDEDEIDLFGDE